MSRLKPKLLFLHGFLGSPKDLQPIFDQLPKFDCFAPDLSKLFPIQDPLYENSFPGLIENLLCYLQKNRIKNFHLAGYSMGGRIAMALCQKTFPLSLTLFSAHFGLLNEEDKTKRWEKALLTASLLKNSTRKTFLEAWYSSSLFSPNLKDELVEDRLKCPYDIDLLEKMFLNLNLAKQPYFLSSLPENTRFVCGANDRKYKELYENNIKRHKKIILPELYHFLPYESPKDCVQLLMDLDP